MSKRKYRCLLISDFYLKNFSKYLEGDKNPPQLDTILSPYDQVIPTFLQEDKECWKENPDFAIVWTTPENSIPLFRDVLEFKNVPLEKILKQVDEFVNHLKNISPRLKFFFIISWTIDPIFRGYGLLNMKEKIGIANILMHMNLRLSHQLEKVKNAYILDAQQWISLIGNKSYNPKLWYMAKIPFSNEIFIHATIEIKSYIKRIIGDTKKLIILDLDNTLWGGIVGDIGWENLRLGGHDHIGEAYVDFQRTLKSLKNRGLLLAIVSKNEENIALEAIKKHPEMILKINDFVDWRINWKDKAKNIVELVSELNLGLQSTVFIDDNPVERDRINSVLPEVFVPDWPKDVTLYKRKLLGLNCFDSVSTTLEDGKRTQMYLEEKERKELKQKLNSVDDWIKTLKIKITIQELNNINLTRTTQLFNKTNQMNLTTRRMNEKEVINWAENPKNKLWTFRVEDKFGDSGLTGIISLNMDDKIGNVVDFILSCRVIGREVEETMLYKLISFCKSKKIDRVVAKYIKTEKNKPCLDFWKRSGFDYDESKMLFIWDLEKKYPKPKDIEIIDETNK